MLACGPLFSFSKNAREIAVLLFAIYPFAYFAFIQSFRYRVNRPIPMPFRKSLRLTVLCLLLGILICVLSFLIGSGVGGVAFVFFFLMRVASWYVVGAKGAGLVGPRLVGWVISGTLINFAFDFALVAGVLSGWIAPLITLGGLTIFIYALHVAGRHDSLKLRFASQPHCLKCAYNLTGNLSGICPECGTRIDALYASLLHEPPG